MEHNFPMPIYFDPAWWQSLLALAVMICTIAGLLIKAFIVNPLSKDMIHLNKQIEEMAIDTKETKEDVKNLLIQLEATNNSVHSAHHRIDGMEERINRIENVFFKNQ